MKKGFTLIEIMVVIVIMGILAAVAMPKLFGQVENAKIAADIQALRGVQQAVYAAALEDSFQEAFNKTIENKARVMRMRISWAVANQDKYALQKLVVDAIKANAGSNFIELGEKSSNSDGRVPTIYQSALLKAKKPDMMVLIVESGSNFKIVTFPTDAIGSSTTVNIYTYRGKPVAAGDIPQNGEIWGNVKDNKITFRYVPLEN